MGQTCTKERLRAYPMMLYTEKEKFISLTSGEILSSARNIEVVFK